MNNAFGDATHVIFFFQVSVGEEQKTLRWPVADENGKVESMSERARQNFRRMRQKGERPRGRVKRSDTADSKTRGKRSLDEYKMRESSKILIIVTV